MQAVGLKHQTKPLQVEIKEETFKVASMGQAKHDHGINIEIT